MKNKVLKKTEIIRRLKISHSLLGNKRRVGSHQNEEFKKMMSKISKGNKYRLGCKMSDEAKKKNK